MLQNMMIHFIRYHGESQLLEQAFKKDGLRLGVFSGNGSTLA